MPEPDLKTSHVDVRLAEPTSSDIEALARLTMAMDRFYDEPDVPPLAAYHRFVEERVLGLGSGTYVAIAEWDGLPMGVAFFAVVYPGKPVQGVIFLKDIFVVEGARDMGIGRALMRFVAEMALEMGCSRVDFGALRDNDAVRAFYDGLGATVDESRVYYLLEGDALNALAAGQ